MRVRLKDSVRLPGGTVSTIATLADEGRIQFNKVDSFHKRGGGTRIAYFAELASGECWEIGKKAYLSRTGQGVEL